jgi:hypothetical protein
LRGGRRPGRSSADGGIEEFPLFRDTIRSSRANRSRSSAISASRAAHDWQPGAGGGRSVTTDHDQGRLAVIKPARWAGPGMIPGEVAARSMTIMRFR